MTREEQQRKASRLRFIWLILPVVLSGAVLYWFSPGEHAFYPRCGLYALTGLQCPGCGGLRAAHSLLHGDLGSALRHNPLLVLLAPGLFVVGLWFAWRAYSGRGFPNWRLQPRWLWLLLLVGIGYAILRNVALLGVTAS